jgi:hypothetical protein
MIHELAHAITGILFHSHPVLHHNYVEHLSPEVLSNQQQAIIALSGPVTSLIQGLMAGWIYFKSKTKRLFELFVLWFYTLGMFNFLGYLMTGPFFENGDIGKVYALLNTPIWIQLLLVIVAMAAILFIAYHLTAPFLRFSFKSDWVNSIASRKKFSFYILLLPWIIGSGIMTLLYLPIVALVSIIYPISSGMVFIFPWQNAARIKHVDLSKDNKIGQISLYAIFFLAILILVFRLVLLPGIKF